MDDIKTLVEFVQEKYGDEGLLLLNKITQSKTELLSTLDDKKNIKTPERYDGSDFALKEIDKAWASKFSRILNNVDRLQEKRKAQTYIEDLKKSIIDFLTDILGETADNIDDINFVKRNDRVRQNLACILLTRWYLPRDNQFTELRQESKEKIISILMKVYQSEIETIKSDLEASWKSFANFYLDYTSNKYSCDPIPLSIFILQSHKYLDYEILKDLDVIAADNKENPDQRVIADNINHHFRKSIGLD